MNITYTIRPSSAATLQANIGISEGISVVSATISTGQRSYLTLASRDPADVYTGTIRIKATTPGDKTVELNTVRLMSMQNTSDFTTLGATVISFHVRTPEEKAAYDAQVAAEQQRIRDEQARQASIAASIAAEQNAERERQARIEESKRKASEEEEERKASIAESIRASESEVERTRPTEIGSKTYAELKLSKERTNGAKYFYFALAENEIDTPEGFYAVSHTLNENKILAMKSIGMDNDTYLVYGQFDTEKRPQFYLYHSKTEEFFPYWYVDRDWAPSVIDPPEESTEESGETDGTESEEESIGRTEKETTPGKSSAGDSFDSPANRRKLFFIGLFSFLIGLVIATIIALLVKKKNGGNGSGKTSGKAEKGRPAGTAAPAPAKNTSSLPFEEIDDAETGRRPADVPEAEE